MKCFVTHTRQRWLSRTKQDPTLKRCFGKDEKIADCDWDYLSRLKTLREPHVGMPRLVDLLKWMTEPGIESIWLLLDIKV
jgi:hypothetical protein